jgi:3'-phosphoadenosine 5'-phosphosulfate sulfotransferase (PAPS reductase)/FAD synthetase
VSAALNPYLIEGPALISFSGGRTSAYMLRMILDAHGGALPDDVHVCFANTGKEREETLRFVHECESRWGVRVRWLEYRADAQRFDEVGFNSASREGEPFAAMIAKYQRVPNAFTRFCTGKLKVGVMTDFMKTLGYKKWASVIGLRADEMLRVFRAMERNQERSQRWTEHMPLADAKVRLDGVLAFWREQSFDLGISPGEGNCDLCFLKSPARLRHSIRSDPASAQWWARMESAVGGQFVNGASYAALVREVANSPLLPLEPGDDDEFDAECGLWCAGEAA